jgi:hypothetical protein
MTKSLRIDELLAVRKLQYRCVVCRAVKSAVPCRVVQAREASFLSYLYCARLRDQDVDRANAALMTGATVPAMPRFSTKTLNGLAPRLELQLQQAIAKSAAVCPGRYLNGGK